MYGSERNEQNIKLLSDLKDYKISEGDPDIRGWDVMDRDNNKIGRVQDLLIDTNRNQATYLLVAYGGIPLMEEATAISIGLVRLDRDDKKILFRGVSDDLKSAPRYRKDMDNYSIFDKYWGAVMPMAGQKMGQRVDEDIENIKGGSVEPAKKDVDIGKEENVVETYQFVENPLEDIVRPKKIEGEDIE